jgi:hypothetical protein
MSKKKRIIERKVEAPTVEPTPVVQPTPVDQPAAPVSPAPVLETEREDIKVFQALLEEAAIAKAAKPTKKPVGRPTKKTVDVPTVAPTAAPVEWSPSVEAALLAKIVDRQPLNPQEIVYIVNQWANGMLALGLSIYSSIPNASV